MKRLLFRDRPWPFMLFLGAGAAALAMKWDFGSAANIGAAVYPLILSGIIVLLAAYGMVAGSPELRSAVDRRAFLAIVTAVLLFALSVERFGLVPAVVLSMVAAYAGQARSRYAIFAVYAFAFGLGTWALFSYGLGLPLAGVRLP